MSPALGETAFIGFKVENAAGALADADSTPTVIVFEDGGASTLSGASVTKRTALTGKYYATVVCTTGNGFEAGKSYEVEITAVIGGVTKVATVKHFQVRTGSVDAARLGDGVTHGGTTAMLSVKQIAVQNTDLNGSAIVLTPGEGGFAVDLRNFVGVAGEGMIFGDLGGSVSGNVAGNVIGNVEGSVASVTGSVAGSVGSVAGAVGSVTGAVGSVTGNVSGSVGSVATNGITAASIASDAITAAKIATGAIDADALAIDAVTEIAAGITIPAAGAIADAVWDELTSGHQTAGTTGKALTTAEAGSTPVEITVNGDSINVSDE